MKIIFCGGGTMGHVSPAIAIAEALSKEYKDTEILFIGRENGEENKAIERAGFELKTIKASGIQRKLSLENIKNIYTAISSVSSAKKIIKEFLPDIIVGTGGYVSFPVLFAGQKLSIPTIIHESNACPGLVTKVLAPKCERVLLNFSGSEKEFKKQNNIKVIGNPIKAEFENANKRIARKKLGIAHGEILISSFGGSGGSQKINDVIIEIINNHSTKNKNIRHIHSCGNKYFKELNNKFPELFGGKDGCIIKPYIDNTATVMAASDIVITRCGAMTLSELSAVGAASILIPSPNVTNNHQYKNAKLISDIGGGILIEEKDLTERSLLDALKLLETNEKLRMEYAKKIHELYRRDTTNKIIDEIMEVATK